MSATKKQSPARTTKKGVAVQGSGASRAKGPRPKPTSQPPPTKPRRLHNRKGALAAKKSKGSGTRRPTTPKGWAIAILKWGALGGVLVGALGAAALAGMFWYYGSDDKLPKIASVQDYKPAQVNRVLSAEGQLIGEIFEQRRSVVAYEELPEIVVQAFVSAEDKGFWQHEGLDYVGMIRAALINVKSGKKKQGASTITQQVVKNLLLSSERTFRRKFQEIILARRLEDALSKEEILMLYANEIFFGHGRYGVQEAARYYYGKTVDELNVGEAAMLAGLPKGPNHYSPKKPKNADRAKARQAYVLTEMANNGYITIDEAQKWIDEPIAVIADSAPMLGMAPEFVELARTELNERIGKDTLKESGSSVVTTVDLKVQALARKALRKNLREFDKRKGYGRPITKLKEDKLKLELVRMAKRLPKQGPKSGEVYRAIVTKVHDADNELEVDLGEFKAAVILSGNQEERFNPDNQKPSERFERGSVIRVELGELKDKSPKHAERQVRLATGPEGAVVIIDPKTRRLVALIGGYDVKLAGFNRATMAKRQAGSTFKPFVYAAAIESGDFTAASIVNDAPEVYDLWKPENYKKGAFSGPVRLRDALNRSVNTVPIRVAHDLGPEQVAKTAQRLGIQSELPEGLSLAIGSGEVTPLELTNAFATVAAGGTYAPVYSVKRVGQDDLERVAPIEVLDPKVSYVVLDMMRSVITDGTGRKAASLGMDIAGKTGTSDNERDAWFIGLSPEYVIGVWIGFDDFRRELGRKEGGSKTALPVFVDLMKELGRRSARFDEPEGIVRVRIDKDSGLLAPDGVLENSYEEVFLDGTAPVEFATKEGEVAADDAILDQYGDFGTPTGDEEPAPSP